MLLVFCLFVWDL